MRKVLTNEIKNERCNAEAFGLFNASVDANESDFILNSDDYSVDADVLKIVFGFDEKEANHFLGLSEKNKIKYDIDRIAKRGDFASKIAQTIIEKGFNQLSSKQADIINRYSIFMYNPIFTKNDHYQMEKREKEAKYRQAGSSLRR